ncbi:irregular chiasm C-roughest protein-like isoform X1 [Penaeus chinensis]|uniref:irregular chiasm C-roughest protein-like isoform X1 n=1 Tax=Penaeus chinensis TaxID=139456 RepID=UPI001FB61267|nr:irregular chiasm C-roughest protein-like isoform X1 [Penaeus chinensis]XP_047477073.1 irregular chiasm C-roughest protein-like isoform X1 [Penaeus chinensis]XP_047477074.1 irregular chiasm C-roughest protein-like isoform X1 [Penaeus chinensis]
MVTRWTLCFSAWVFCSSLAGSEWGVSAMWAAGIRQDAARGPTVGSGGATMIQKDPRLGPGMGGSAVQLMGYEGAQYFATQPTPQTAVVGSTAVLPCRVINKVGHLQWTKDGFGMGTERDLFGFARYAMIGSDDEGDFSLRIKPVLLEDDGLYQCQVSASDGVPGIRSQTARLTVYVPPEAPRVKPPVLQTTAGMTVNLECESRGGRPSPEIQWVDDSQRETVRSGTSLSTEMMSDGKRVIVRSRLAFTPRRSHHNSTITCLTSHQALSSPLTSSIQLEVLFPPEVGLTVRPQLLVEGDDASFICSAEANPNVITYKWYHNNQELENKTSKTLILPKISRNLHQSAISCEVSNKVGTSKKTQSVHVQYGPMFRALPRDVAAETGKQVVLKCDVDSNPPSSIVWLQEGSDKIIGSGAELRVVVGASTAGVYRCVAAVRGFPDLQGRLRVLVKGPPMIVSSSDQQGRMGDTVTLECNTVSIPSPIRITWTYRGREIDLSDPRYEVVEDEQEEGFRNILVIHDADTHDFGSYNCSVVNEYGVARKQIRLNEEKRVPMLMLAGGAVVFALVAVVVISLVLCNKRHSNSSGSPVPEKPPAATVVTGPTVANMYSAPSDTKLSSDLTPTPSNRPYDELTPTEDSNARAAHTLNRLSEDSAQTFIPDPDADGGRGYVPFVDYSGRDYAPVPNGRRASFGDLDTYSTPTPPSSTASDYCTIKRGSRGHGPPVGNGTGVAGTNFAESPTLRHNGTGPAAPRHSSPFSPHRNNSYGSPPPPPYPRGGGGKLDSPRGNASPTGTATLTRTNSVAHADERCSPETKYIFSPEAMMKPGTLV